jgi:hypothetical protein
VLPAGDLLPPADELHSALQHRRGKGGRQPASDPRLDPKIDPKKARRILANRQSAARSKLKQKVGCPPRVVGRPAEHTRPHTAASHLTQTLQ